MVVVDEVAVATLCATDDGSALDLRTKDGEAADRTEDADSPDAPLKLGLPVNRFEDAPCGGRGHNVVRDPLHLHLGTGKTGEIAPDLEAHRCIVCFHNELSWIWALEPRLIRASAICLPCAYKVLSTEERHKS